MYIYNLYNIYIKLITNIRHCSMINIIIYMYE